MRISFFLSITGRCYVEEFLDELLVSDRVATLAALQNIENYGLSSVGCQFRQIEGKLWEIKIKAPSGAYQFFYTMLSHSELICLHVYKKKSQKAPQKELAKARKRLREVLK